MSLSDLLTRFIHLQEDLKVLASAISHEDLRMACKEPICTLTMEDIKNALDRYLHQELTETELTYWADFLEQNPCIEYEVGHESEIAEVLFRLASPEINGDINVSDVTALRNLLS